MPGLFKPSCQYVMKLAKIINFTCIFINVGKLTYVPGKSNKNEKKLKHTKDLSKIWRKMMISKLSIIRAFLEASSYFYNRRVPSSKLTYIWIH